MFDYQPTGSLSVNGCAAANFKKLFIYLFSIGSKAYIKRKARFGKMEFVVIKKIYRQFPSNVYEGIQAEIFYLDTYNRIWAENELIMQENALNLATAYWQFVQQEERDLYSRCSPISPEGC